MLGTLSATLLEMAVVAKGPLGTELERRPEEPGRIGIAWRVGVAVVVAVIAIGGRRIPGGRSISRASAEPKTDGQRCRERRADRKMAVDH